MKTTSQIFLSGVSGALAVVLLIAGCDNKSPVTSNTPATAVVAAEVSDIDVTTRVKTALLSDADTNKFNIAVVTLKGDVRLTGILDNQSQIDRALSIVRGVAGAHSIHDELSLAKKP